MSEHEQEPRPDEVEGLAAPQDVDAGTPADSTAADELHQQDVDGEPAAPTAGEAPASRDPMESQEMLHVDRYEGAWMRITAAVIGIFFVAVVISGFAVGFQLPGVYERIDPATLYDAGSPWADPVLRELAPGKYEVYIRAQIWSFTPGEIRVPAGSEVTFYVTSADVQHGFKLQDTNINMMVLPGQVNTLTAKFENPGTYDFICHEYCGQLHHTMYGQLIVEPEQLAENEGESD